GIEVRLRHCQDGRLQLAPLNRLREVGVLRPLLQRLVLLRHGDTPSLLRGSRTPNHKRSRAPRAEAAMAGRALQGHGGKMAAPTLTTDPAWPRRATTEIDEATLATLDR